MTNAVVVKTAEGDKEVEIPKGWHVVPIGGGNICQPGDRFYHINNLRFEDAVQSDMQVSSFFFELLIRKDPKPKRHKK
jgi:hypothetical protein